MDFSLMDTTQRDQTVLDIPDNPDDPWDAAADPMELNLASLLDSIPSTEDSEDLPEALSESETESTQPLFENPPSPKARTPPTATEVEFRVGQDRQLMIGPKAQLASISPVFSDMFSSKTWFSEDKKQTVVEIPDVQTQSFGVILRHAERDKKLPLSDDTVWKVLHAANQFQILPVVTQCFHFLLHKHSQRRNSRHLCKVLEEAHHLDYSEHYAKCLHRIKRHAGKVLKSSAALSELCHQCMLEIITADDLPVPEILVHDAVVMWARAAWRPKPTLIGSNPSWDELRAIAGQLVYHVRYLTIPRVTLQALNAGQPSCLLSQKEKTSLLEGNLSGFPKHVSIQRKGMDGRRWACELVSKLKDRKVMVFFSVMFFVAILLLFLFVYVGLLPDMLAPRSESESPLFILITQEEQQ